MNVSRNDAKQNPKDIGSSVSSCMLSNSLFTVAGVVIGTFFGVRRKNFQPLIIGAFVGSLSDLVYGYTITCRSIIEEFEVATRAKKQ